MSDRLNMDKVDETMVKLKAVGIIEGKEDWIKVTPRFKEMLRVNFIDIAQSKKILSNNPSKDDLLGMSLLLTLVEWLKEVTESEEGMEDMRYAMNLLFLVLTGRAPTKSTLGDIT